MREYEIKECLLNIKNELKVSIDEVGESFLNDRNKELFAIELKNPVIFEIKYKKSKLIIPADYISINKFSGDLYVRMKDEYLDFKPKDIKSIKISDVSKRLFKRCIGFRYNSLPNNLEYLNWIIFSDMSYMYNLIKELIKKRTLTMTYDEFYNLYYINLNKKVTYDHMIIDQIIVDVESTTLLFEGRSVYSYGHF